MITKEKVDAIVRKLTVVAVTCEGESNETPDRKRAGYYKGMQDAYEQAMIVLGEIGDEGTRRLGVLSQRIGRIGKVKISGAAASEDYGIGFREGRAKGSAAVMRIIRAASKEGRG